MKNYTEEDVIWTLSRKSDVRIQGKQVLVMKGSAAKNDIGNGSKGKIDFLCRHKGYTLVFTSKF